MRIGFFVGLSNAYELLIATRFTGFQTMNRYAFLFADNKTCYNSEYEDYRRS